MDHIECHGWSPLKKCEKKRTTDIVTVVGSQKIRNGLPHGVVTTYCPGCNGACPDWISRSPQLQ